MNDYSNKPGKLSQPLKEGETQNWEEGLWLKWLILSSWKDPLNLSRKRERESKRVYDFIEKRRAFHAEEEIIYEARLQRRKERWEAKYEAGVHKPFWEWVIYNNENLGPMWPLMRNGLYDELFGTTYQPRPKYASSFIGYNAGYNRFATGD
jgi:hypothetical protein